MYLKDARKFIVDFGSDPTLRLEIVKIKLKKGKNNLSNFDKLTLMQTAARDRGYRFTMDELKEANNCTFGEVEDLELVNVSGGLTTNKHALSQAFPITNIGDLFDIDLATKVDEDLGADMETG